MKRHLVKGNNSKKKTGIFRAFQHTFWALLLCQGFKKQQLSTAAFSQQILKKYLVNDSGLYQIESRIKIGDVGQPNVLVTLSCVAVQKRCSSITNCMLATVLRLQNLIHANALYKYA